MNRNMKRAWLWLFNLAAAVSLMVCLATIVSGMRGFWTKDQVQIFYNTYPGQRPHFARWFSVLSGNGTIHFSYLRNDYSEMPPPTTRVQRKIAAMPARSSSWSSAPGLNVHWSTSAAETSIPFISRMTQFGRAHSDERLLYQHNEMWIYTAPAWFFVAAFALLPGIWLVRVRRQRRRLLTGMCVTCGYDLRATPERCPECGVIPPAVKGTT